MSAPREVVEAWKSACDEHALVIKERLYLCSCGERFDHAQQFGDHREQAISDAAYAASLEWAAEWAEASARRPLRQLTHACDDDWMIARWLRRLARQETK